MSSAKYLTLPMLYLVLNFADFYEGKYMWLPEYTVWRPNSYGHWRAKNNFRKLTEVGHDAAFYTRNTKIITTWQTITALLSENGSTSRVNILMSI